MLTLSIVPKHHPDCCLSISRSLFTCLAGCLGEITESGPKETILLSVGCGTGFFEAAFAAYLQEQGFSRIKVEGVEVASAHVKYLSSELVHHVPGTRSICQRAQDAVILLFAYPREVDLIRRYLTQFGSNVRTMVWLGPRNDWITQTQVLQSIPNFDESCILENAGLASYEVAVAYQNRAHFRPERNTPSVAIEGALSLDIDSI